MELVKVFLSKQVEYDLLGSLQGGFSFFQMFQLLWQHTVLELRKRHLREGGSNRIAAKRGKNLIPSSAQQRGLQSKTKSKEGQGLSWWSSG